jgi:hypothetical protein
MNELDIVAYNANQGCWWSFLYIVLNHAKQHARMQKYERKILKNKTKHKTQFALNP